MRISPALLLVVVCSLACSAGCSGTPTDGSRFNLPTFDAPDQWEPELQETNAGAASDS